jgi:hypothetical protein
MASEAKVDWSADDNGMTATVTLQGRLWTGTFFAQFRSPYSPWVIQLRRSYITNWTDGTAISTADRDALWAAVCAAATFEAEEHLD